LSVFGFVGLKDSWILKNDLRSKCSAKNNPLIPKSEKS
jgi:hypothetical protein